jgi:hypothetical protein
MIDKRFLITIATFATLFLAPQVASAQSTTGSYAKPPTGGTNQWYWEISPPNSGLAGLPSTAAGYPAPGSANIWDTDLFQDSNVADGGIPTGPSPVVAAIHAAGHYSICYVEACAYQEGFPDDANFATADYGGVGNEATQMQGYADEFWFDLTGFKNYVAGQPSTLSGAALNVAAGLDDRFARCKLEGQDAVEPDDLDGYTNQSQSGVTPWSMVRADSAGFERWLSYDIHANGLAAFQKNDPANASADAPLFDGMIIEECNFYNDPCAGSSGDATAYLAAGKPVLNAEYSQDGETTAKFCTKDEAAGIVGALFNVSLAGGTYGPCAPATATSPAPPGTPAPPAPVGSAPRNTGLPALRGRATEGNSLSVSNGSWSNSPTSFAYQWQLCKRGVCADISGATKSSYKLSSADVGDVLDAVVAAKNTSGSASATSAASPVITAPSSRSHH